MLPSGTVTFMFTDIEGSTGLLRELGDGYSDLLGRERSMLRETLGSAGGQEIDTQGDAFFFSFTRARDAVTGALRSAPSPSRSGPAASTSRCAWACTRASRP